VELEDAFREIIVIDDDDDSDDSSSSGDTADEQASSVEIVTSQTATHGLRADDPIGPERLVVDERGRVLRRAYIALPRPRSAVAVHSNPRLYPSCSDHPERLVVRRHATKDYLPPPAEFQSRVRLPVRLAETVRRPSPPAGRHGREDYVVTYPYEFSHFSRYILNQLTCYRETRLRPVLASGREEPAPRTYTPTARVYAEVSGRTAMRLIAPDAVIWQGQNC